jgi:folate-binding protein YgfZ
LCQNSAFGTIGNLWKNNGSEFSARMSNEWNLIELDDLGVLRLRGPDAVRFLQGQVSNDVERLTPERSLLAGYHNPQGRAIALLRLVQLAPDDLLAILPRELAATVASRLGKFVLRAKVKISEESAAWRVTGLVAPYVVAEHGATDGAAGHAGAGRADRALGGAGRASGVSREGIGHEGAGEPGETRGLSAAEASGGGGASVDEPREYAASRETDEAFEERAKSWAAGLFEQARARVAAAGEQSAAAVHLQDSDSVVELPTVSAFMLPDAVHAVSLSEGTVVIRVGASPARWLVVSPVGETPPLATCTVGSRDAWRLLDIADGVAQVYAATSEEFVAQMLNLDVMGGISFEKGCYTGQEVIARAHYRGRVKRRMQRFLSRGAARLAVGDSGQLTDGRAFKVVEAAQLGDGRCEFLAVAQMVTGTGAGGVAGDGARGDVLAAGAAGSGAGTVGDAGAAVDAEGLPLPYLLPE